MTTSEVNTWAPTGGTGSSAGRPSSGPSSTPSRNKTGSPAPLLPPPEPPADVYELRRRQERAREMARAMTETTDRTQAQYSPIVITSAPGETRTSAAYPYLQGNILFQSLVEAVMVLEAISATCSPPIFHLSKCITN
ncbi:hypothetical protein COOONC_13415 [Cooperia oncophora]